MTLRHSITVFFFLLSSSARPPAFQSHRAGNARGTFCKWSSTRRAARLARARTSDTSPKQFWVWSKEAWWRIGRSGYNSAQCADASAPVCAGLNSGRSRL